MTVNEESLGFEILVGKKKQSADWPLGNSDRYFSLFSHFIDQMINQKNIPQMNRK